MAKRRETFDVSEFGLQLPDGGGQLKTFELEEYDGDAEVAAAERSGGVGNQVAYQLHLMAESIVTFNGVEVPMRPYLPLMKWSSRTLDFARVAIDGFSSATNKEIAAFRKAVAARRAGHGAKS
jgi:hypothetical protein